MVTVIFSAVIHACCINRTEHDFYEKYHTSQYGPLNFLWASSRDNFLPVKGPKIAPNMN